MDNVHKPSVEPAILECFITKDTNFATISIDLSPIFNDELKAVRSEFTFISDLLAKLSIEGSAQVTGFSDQPVLHWRLPAEGIEHLMYVMFALSAKATGFRLIRK
jgi:hypothetical protein